MVIQVVCWEEGGDEEKSNSKRTPQPIDERFTSIHRFRFSIRKSLKTQTHKLARTHARKNTTTWKSHSYDTMMLCCSTCEQPNNHLYSISFYLILSLSTSSLVAGWRNVHAFTHLWIHAHTERRRYILIWHCDLFIFSIHINDFLFI